MVGHVHVLRFAGQHICLALLDQFEALDTIAAGDALHADARLGGIGEQFLAIIKINLRHTQAI